MTRKTFILYWTAEQMYRCDMAVKNGTMLMSEASMTQLDSPRYASQFWRRHSRTLRQMAKEKLFSLHRTAGGEKLLNEARDLIASASLIGKRGAK